jgi:putative heme-binding domain-containing protein
MCDEALFGRWLRLRGGRRVSRMPIAAVCGLMFAAFVNGVVVMPRIAAGGPPVAPTEALTPEEQRTHFKVPAGFEIQLVAAEPEIQKPMNLNFDSRGRLWVTHSVEYPFAASDPAQARDGVTILSDFGPDGRARRVERFADRLNIPIGVLPLGAGREAIVWSIPNIWKLTDDDGDGKCDRREVLYGPFDIADTHGNQNAFRLMPDGWVYACHGFRNDSKVKLRGEGPVVMQLQSGNTYRFRPDGSAIEQVTWGQVNPFGMCFDRWGNAYSADCHSKPITQLIRGGYYESFGKPHDGLGFAPSMTKHDHDSTGIAGVAYYDAVSYPAEYRHCFYVGNVITNVIHRDVPQWRGSSPWIAAPVDFVSCSDPWFHPVDIQLGPDGALYFADFYNSIIGHYEVDLKHPRRDRHRGRVWRVVWRGGDASAAKPTAPTTMVDFTKLDAKQLVDRLSDENIVIRQRATLELQQRRDANTLAAAAELPSDSLGAAQAVWLAAHAGRLAEWIASARTAQTTLLTKTQMLTAAAELPEWDSATADWVRVQLQDESPFVRRFAAAALARHIDGANVPPLLAAFASTAADDEQLLHTLKIALRNQFRSPTALAVLSDATQKLPADRTTFVIELVLASPSLDAAQWAFNHLKEHDPQSPLMDRSISQLVRFAPNEVLDEVVSSIAKQYGSELGRRATALRAVMEGMRQRGGTLSADSRAGEWAKSIAIELLTPQRQPEAAWTQMPLESSAGKPSPSPWGVRKRRCEDGQEVAVWDSIVGGESLTGVLRSASFTIPAKFSFYLCGHNGVPGSNPPQTNHVRLRLVDTGDVVLRQSTPRNDVAQKYTWDLSRWAGQRGLLEVVDADTAGAYAWIGIGRFEPAVVEAPAEGLTATTSPLDLAIQVVEQLKLVEHMPALMRVIDDVVLPASTRVAAAQAAFTLSPATASPRLVLTVGDSTQPAPLRIKAADLLVARNGELERKAVVDALASAPATLQPTFALSLASHPSGVEALLATISAGKASPRLLQEKTVVDRLRASGVAKIDERIATLTQGLPAAEERMKKLQMERFVSWSSDRGNIESGRAVFKKQCATCHKAAGEGAMVGPQLDGIGNRGAERLLEDLLDPNRNVDAAFRTTIITKTNGQVVSGLKLRQEGNSTVLANNEGKEFQVSQEEIDETRQSALSLMPGNFADTLTARESLDLLEYLLSLTNRPAVTR